METTQLVSVREAAKILGISRQQVDRLRRRNVLPWVDVGGRVMLTRAAVESRRRALGVRRPC